MTVDAHIQRRRQVLAQIEDGVAIIPTAPERLRNRDTHYPYRFDSYFWYLSGFPEPEAVIVLLGGENPKDLLFCREKDPEREIWDGFRHGPDAAAEKFGFAEACPLALAPTSSTTASLAMGDALAVALLEARGFTSEDFARSHPAGALGRRPLLHIADVMHTGDDIPRVGPDATLGDALLEMSRKRLGMTAVVDDDGRLLGLYTDGDLRRSLADPATDVHTTPIDRVMTRAPVVIDADALAVEAAQLMEAHKINALLVVDGDRRVVGALNIHDLLRARVV